MFGATSVFFSLHLALFFFLSGTSWYGHLNAFDQVSVSLKERFNASAQQECVLVAFFIEQLCVLDALSFVNHVADDKFVWRILEPVQFGDRLVSGNIGGREIDRLLDMPFLIFIRISKVKQQELSVCSDS